MVQNVNKGGTKNAEKIATTQVFIEITFTYLSITAGLPGELQYPKYCG